MLECVWGGRISKTGNGRIESTFDSLSAPHTVKRGEALSCEAQTQINCCLEGNFFSPFISSIKPCLKLRLESGSGVKNTGKEFLKGSGKNIFLHLYMGFHENARDKMIEV